MIARVQSTVVGYRFVCRNLLTIAVVGIDMGNVIVPPQVIVPRQRLAAESEDQLLPFEWDHGIKHSMKTMTEETKLPCDLTLHFVEKDVVSRFLLYTNFLSLCVCLWSRQP